MAWNGTAAAAAMLLHIDTAVWNIGRSAVVGVRRFSPFMAKGRREVVKQ